MAKKVREENIPLINYVTEVKEGDVSDNQEVQRYFCSDNAFINGIGVTVLTGDYLPPLILAEVPLGDDIVQKYVADGLQRTTALMKIRYGNYKFTGNIEDGEIEYQEKQLDKNGKFAKDEDGNFIWEKKVFNLKNKTYDDFPKELKKRFDNYQIRIATYQDCTMEMVSKLVRKLNQQKGMNSNQQSITWIPSYARKIKNIADSGFFKNSITYSDEKRKKSEYMQVVCRSVMDVFHFDEYKRGAKDICIYLENNSSDAEFDKIHEYFNRIESVCGEKFKDLFANKDIPVWMAVFDKFSKYNLDDVRFADFLDELVSELHSKEIDGDSYDSLYKEVGTTDKKLVNRKITLFTSLMNEYLHIDETEKENITLNDDNVLEFIKENADSKATEEDVSFYEDMVDDCVKIDSPVYTACKLALVALMAYACIKEQDESFEEWIKKYEGSNSNFSNDQRVNYTYMKRDFDKFVATAA